MVLLILRRIAVDSFSITLWVLLNVQDFANAVDKMSRAGYKGEHGDFEVPHEITQQLNALYMQVTVGDYG